MTMDAGLQANESALILATNYSYTHEDSPETQFHPVSMDPMLNTKTVNQLKKQTHFKNSTVNLKETI